VTLAMMQRKDVYRVMSFMLSNNNQITSKARRDIYRQKLSIEAISATLYIFRHAIRRHQILSWSGSHPSSNEREKRRQKLRGTT